jgi:hypothetical protein
MESIKMFELKYFKATLPEKFLDMEKDWDYP